MTYINFSAGSLEEQSSTLNLGRLSFTIYPYVFGYLQGNQVSRDMQPDGLTEACK